MAENEYTAKKVILKNNKGEYLIPYVEFPIATETSAGIVQPDNSTISVNNGTITAEGIKTKNDILKCDWIGTKAEWEAGRENGTILDSWVCYITDDFVQTDTSGTMNYNELENIPTIGGIELKGNKELGELGIQSKLTAGEGINIDGNVISAAGGGGGSVPDNVYTSDNLIAGKNVTFTEVPPEGGIDSHTKALWHFDEDKIDVIGGISCPNNIYASQYKFGTGSIRPNKTSTTKTDISSLGLDTTKEVTVDFWFKPYSASNTEVVGLCATPTDGLLLRIGATVSLSGAYWTDGDGTVVVSGLDVANWYHCGFVYDPSSKAVSIFIDGEKKGTYGVTGTPSFTAFALYGSASYPYVDELRISDIIRYTSNFTPLNEAYTVATGPSKTAVNAIVAVPAKTSELENDSGFVTSSDIPDTSSFVQTTGSTITGNILLDGAAIRAKGTDSFTQLAGAEAVSNGARLNLFGKDYSNNPGEFALYANNGSSSKILLGKPDGTLTWGGKNLITEEQLSNNIIFRDWTEE